MPSKAGFIAAAAAILALASNLGAAKIVERIIARVNNEIITQRQFDRDRQQLRARLAGDYSGVELEVQVREQSKNLLRDMIDQDLMVQKAKDLDINVETGRIVSTRGVPGQNLSASVSSPCSPRAIRAAKPMRVRSASRATINCSSDQR